MQKIKVVAAAVDTTELTLYLDNGETLRIPQGDPRVKKIIDEVTPIVTAGGVAEVDLTSESAYAKFEEETNGLVKFFKVAKKKLSSFFKRQEEEVSQENKTIIGTLPSPKQEVPEIKQTQEIEKLNSAIDEIMMNAVPVHSNDVIKETESVIAVVNQKQVVPDAHMIKSQITNSLATGTTGMKRFMERVASVSAKRAHSVEDLMKFLEKGDLPIADDGSIIIYKVLRRKGGDERTYVDCHTRKVPQRVGSYVHMDPSLVDPNRRNECSNGLHVARRGYVGGFNGDVCVIAKVAPEDVIAVPEYDANKMRVCGYHILFELSDSDYSKLKSNKPITDTEEGRILLGRAMSGDHPEPIEDVKIGGHMGQNVKVTPRAHTTAPVVEVKPATAIDIDKPDPGLTAPVVSPVDVERAVIENKTQASVGEEAPQKAPEDEKTEQAIPAVPEAEKTAPKPDVTPVATAIQAVATSKGTETTKVPDPVTKLIPASPDHAPGGKLAKTATKPVAKKESPLKGTKVSAGTESPRQRIRALLDKKILNKEQAMAVFAIKKAAKKSWEVLGVSEKELKSMEKYLGK